MSRRILPCVLLSLLLAVTGSASAASRLIGELLRANDKPLETFAGIDTEYGGCARRTAPDCERS